MIAVRTKGFTLIEVLIALAIFSIGLLGLGMQLAKNLDATISKEVHSAVSQLVLQSVEPLNRAVLQSKQIFLNKLTEIDTYNIPVYGTNNSEKSNFKITIAQAVDRNGASLFSTNSSNWLPPYQVILNVEYFPSKGENALNFKSTHVFVPISLDNS